MPKRKTTLPDDPCVSLVDPDKATQQSVRAVVETMNLECKVFASGRDFLESEVYLRPGCVLLEVRIPAVNGLQIQGTLSELGMPLSTVFLTSHGTISIAVRAMQNGAVHFLEKPFREHELWDTIQEAVALDAQRREAYRQRQECDQRLGKLTEKELWVLEMVAEGRSTRAMAGRMDVCVRTVELRRRQLMKKLGLKSIVELVHFALVAMNGNSSVKPSAALFEPRQLLSSAGH
jgi:FixJ family two-component response regulator